MTTKTTTKTTHPIDEPIHITGSGGNLNRYHNNDHPRARVGRSYRLTTAHLGEVLVTVAQPVRNLGRYGCDPNQDELIFDEPLTAVELAECEARLEAARASWDD